MRDLKNRDVYSNHLNIEQSLVFEWSKHVRLLNYCKDTEPFKVPKSQLSKSRLNSLCPNVNINHINSVKYGCAAWVCYA